MKKLFLALTITIFAISAYAQTKIKGGEVSGTWTRSGSPYLIENSISVPDGATLTIEAGSTVQFQGFYSLIVKGRLIAKGTKTDTIVFTINDTTGYNDGFQTGWNGIRFHQPPATNDSSVISYCRLEYGEANGVIEPFCFGGAVYIEGFSKISIENCLFTHNRGHIGGAIYCLRSNAIIRNNTFTYNSTSSDGGAVALVESNALVTGNYFTGNKVPGLGAAVYSLISLPLIINNTIIKNTAGYGGGGIYCAYGKGSLINAVIKDTATLLSITKTVKLTQAEAVDYRTIQYVTDDMDATLNKSYKIAKQVTRKITVPEIINNVIANNSAPEGGGILCVETNARIINNTITNNTATDQGGGLCCKRSHPQVINTILYGNTANEGNQISRCVRSFPVINYSNIEGGSTAIYERNDILITDGIRKHVKDIDSLMALQMRGALAYSYNMDVVPAFENEAKFDFRLKDYSQCINTGTSDTLLLYLPDFDNTGNIRIGRNGIDMGAYELEKVVKDTKNSKTETIVNPLYNLQVQMYPNPTTGQFTLTILDNTFNVFTISIHNAMAQTVFTETCNSEAGLFSKAMDLSSEPKGVYALEIIADGMIIYSDKIILE